MKAEITYEGVLQITCESELEAYVLKQWLKDNPTINQNIQFSTAYP